MKIWRDMMRAYVICSNTSANNFIKDRFHSSNMCIEISNSYLMHVALSSPTKLTSPIRRDRISMWTLVQRQQMYWSQMNRCVLERHRAGKTLVFPSTGRTSPMKSYLRNKSQHYFHSLEGIAEGGQRETTKGTSEPNQTTVDQRDQNQNDIQLNWAKHFDRWNPCQRNVSSCANNCQQFVSETRQVSSEYRSRFTRFPIQSANWIHARSM